MELTVEQKEVCRQAVETFGTRAQALKAAEELRELADELDKMAYGNGTVDGYVDERADVAIVLYQVDELLLPAFRAQVEDHIPVKIQKLKGYMGE